MLLLPFAHPCQPALTRRSREVLAGGAASVLLAATALSPLTSPLLPARLAWPLSGLASSRAMSHWVLPTAASLRLAVSLGDRRERYVVYNVAPGDDRLTNFWLAPYDAVGDREFFRWSVLTANALPDICNLLATQPDRIVVTADPTAADQFAEQCGLTDVNIRLLPMDDPAVTLGEVVPPRI